MFGELMNSRPLEFTWILVDSSSVLLAHCTGRYLKLYCFIFKFNTYCLSFRERETFSAIGWVASAQNRTWHTRWCISMVPTRFHSFCWLTTQSCDLEAVQHRPTLFPLSHYLSICAWFQPSSVTWRMIGRSTWWFSTTCSWLTASVTGSS